MNFLRQTSKLGCLRASRLPPIARMLLNPGVKSPHLQLSRRPFNTSTSRPTYFQPGDREAPEAKSRQSRKERDGEDHWDAPPPPRFNRYFNTPNIVVGGLVGACIGMYAYTVFITYELRTKASPRAISAQRWLADNFIHSLKNVKEGRYYTSVTSAFMHQSLLHLAMNMVGLWGFGRLMVSGIGAPSFLVLYFGSVVAGSLAQEYIWDKRGLWNAGGLGASGGVLGVFAATACIMPRGQMGFLFIPMPMWVGAALMVGLSVGGMQDRWLPGLGHADHLGGMAFGSLWWLIAIRRGRFYRRR
ncbi:hypothetical protein N431DRAFT_405343 [Stipitochalara longipes BDJ]|nr:hypothetical protein N431DRAFT_405343 [Stipitochalara longipes BDJ]